MHHLLGNDGSDRRRVEARLRPTRKRGFFGEMRGGCGARASGAARLPQRTQRTKRAPPGAPSSIGPVGFPRAVAIKRLRSEFQESPDLAVDEARIASRIRIRTSF